MVMKAVLDSLDGVNASVQTEYKKGDDGKFYLDLEGVEAHPSTQPLANTMKNVKGELQRTKTELGTFKSRAEELENELNGIREGAIPKSDVDKLKGSYQAKYDKDTGELTTKLQRTTAVVEKLMVTDVAKTLASDLVAKPEFIEVLLPHIQGRLKLDHDADGNPKTVVLDKDGTAGAATLEDLRKEVLSNKAFATILRGSHSSGGSASGSGDRTSGAQKRIDPKTFDMAKATPAEIVAFRKQQAGQ